MEKLLDLLNEYSSRWYYNKEDIQWQVKAWILSKEYWFIKWLVDNDKIDRERFYDKARNIISDFDLKWKYEWASNEVIMLLAISDTPIYDLISYLR